MTSFKVERPYVASGEVCQSRQVLILVITKISLVL